MYGDVPNFALGPVVLVHPAMKEYLMAWFGGIILKYTAVVFERSAALVSSHPPASYEPCFKASIYLHFAIVPTDRCADALSLTLANTH